MEQYLRQLVEIEFQDKKQIFSGFLIDYSDEWILLRNNPVDFEQAKSELIEKVLKFSTLGPKVIANHKHPFFGEMTNEEWDLLQWKHLNHHLNQFGV